MVQALTPAKKAATARPIATRMQTTNDLAEPRPDALGNRLSGPVVFRQRDGEHQIGEQPGPSEQGDHDECDPDQGGVEADVLGEAAGHAPEDPVVLRAEKGAARAHLVFFSCFFLLGFFGWSVMTMTMKPEALRVYRESSLRVP